MFRTRGKKEMRTFLQWNARRFREGAPAGWGADVLVSKNARLAKISERKGRLMKKSP